MYYVYIVYNIHVLYYIITSCLRSEFYLELCDLGHCDCQTFCGLFPTHSQRVQKLLFELYCSVNISSYLIIYLFYPVWEGNN